jgi:hypothetical protein
MTDDDAILRAHTRMNSLNAADPSLVETPSGPRPRELVMAERLERWVHLVVRARAERLEPGAPAGDVATPDTAATPSIPLRLAARGQHLERWKVPRSEYEPGRIGYLRWRKELSHRHAERVAEILRSEGFDEETISATTAIVRKESLTQNPDTRAMEDALCLSFLEHEFSEFAAKHPEDQVVGIVRKTWQKMSPLARDLALQLRFEGGARDLILGALSEE